MDAKTFSTAIAHVSSSTILNIYDHSEEESKKLLAELILRMKAEISTEKGQLKVTLTAG